MVIHFLIRGRVQGVGFRWYAQREAAELGLRGWVRNRETGEVELVASGAVEDLDDLRAALKKGSRGSRVDNIIEHELAESEAEALGPFEIEGAW
jgi:acylphosphatase